MRAARIAILSVVLIEVGCRSPSTDRPSPPVAPVASPLLLQRMSVLANGQTLDAAQATTLAAEINRGQKSMQEYVDSLLSRPETGSHAAVQALFPSLADFGGVYLTKLGPSHILKRTDDGIHYLKEPCKRSESVAVAPWWAPDTTIQVCASAYRPETFKVGANYCSGLFMEFTGWKECGCGPNLVRCYGDKEQAIAFANGVTSEIPDTVAYVVNNDLPLDKLYTSRETVRTKAVEMFYRRERVEAAEGGAIDSENWNLEGTWAPRSEGYAGMHAGILTTPSLIYMTDDPRSRLRNYYELMWCSSAASVDVNSKDIFALGVVDLRAGDGWKGLAKMPICTNCHARLDYGMQFFPGFPYTYVGRHIVTSAFQPARGPLYNADIQDLRGEAELNPRAFAELAVKQPEFRSCIAKRIGTYVFGSEIPSSVEDEIAAALSDNNRLKPALKVALLNYAKLVEAPSAAPVYPTGGKHTGNTIAVAKSTTKLLDAHCVDCHGGTKAEKMFANPAQFDETSLRVMLNQVAFGAMPPDGSLNPADRHAIVNALVGELWSDPQDRTAASAYFVGRLRTVGVHRPNVLNKIIAAAVGAPAPHSAFRPPDRIVDSDRTQLSPGLATEVGLEALRVCKATGAKTPDELFACVQKATELPMLSR